MATYMTCYEPPPEKPRCPLCYPLLYVIVFFASMVVLTGLVMELVELRAVLEPGGMAGARVPW
jgi:hypothetical protein